MWKNILRLGGVFSQSRNTVLKRNSFKQRNTIFFSTDVPSMDYLKSEQKRLREEMRKIFTRDDQRLELIDIEQFENFLQDVSHHFGSFNDEMSSKKREQASALLKEMKFYRQVLFPEEFSTEK